VIFRRRFGDLVSRQLDFFQDDYAGLIEECDDAEAQYVASDRTEAEELYGDYMDLVETGTEVLAELRDNYASTLDDEVADEYLEAFNRGVVKRFPRFGLEIEDT
jgi:hypothetical protein